MLTGHDQVVSGLDWAPTCGLLASCSHDGGCFVWRKDPGGGEWTPLLVVTRLNRAALCLKWSPSEGKFALGTGARTACVCHYEADNDWWVAKKIKQHESSVTSVAWHPSSAILATTSTDRRCRLFNALIQGVEGDSGHCEAAESTLFGDLLMTIECKWWPHAVAFSPRGARLAVATHGSTIVIVDGLDAQEPNGLANKDILEVKLRGLPLRSLSFLSESVLVGGGFDGEPVVLAMTAQSSQSEWTVAQGDSP
ncbi:unnamed protein product [Ostreobium quekettii]|uniref:Arp2/3 complex 41 kDa subunit n=1 Tax=Ostreobium quekettii TaxID=121088 RepID=A0A8S1J8U0_9CHLO|nr:unnamed protein product [Ostreobium quekettii]